MHKLLAGLERIGDALDNRDYAALELRIGEYDHALRASCSAPEAALSREDCELLQRRHAQIQGTMQQLREEASRWLQQHRRSQQMVQAYAGSRASRRRSLALR